VKDVLATLDDWAAQGHEACVATVVAVRRSAPRPPGAKMAISSAGDVVGMVSGGCVEGQVIQAAMDVLEGAPPHLLSFGIADDEAWEVGLPCGGEIDVWVQRHEHASPFAAVAREDGRAVEVTTLAGPEAGAKRLVLPGDEDPNADLLWLERSERRGDVFADATYPAPRLLIFGAVDYADALSRLARTCGWRPYVIDPRGFFARPDRFPAAEEVVAAWPEEALERIGALDRATYVATLTHDPKLDDAAVGLALRSEARYIGAMGSRKANAARRERLLEQGFTEADLERIAMPIGLDLGAITPEETALSIMAEISAIRNGRPGGRLRYAEGRIHEVGDSAPAPS
jgi:xanthine dehydrogenase accessory factor